MNAGLAAACLIYGKLHGDSLSLEYVDDRIADGRKKRIDDACHEELYDPFLHIGTLGLAGGKVLVEGGRSIQGAQAVATRRCSITVTNHAQFGYSIKYGDPFVSVCCRLGTRSGGLWR